MITVVFGGCADDLEFELWLKSIKFVHRFNAVKQGELARFSFAVNDSCNIIVENDYYGKELKRTKANDPMVIHVYDEDLNTISVNRIKSFLLLADDAGLGSVVRTYKSAAGEELAKNMWNNKE